MSAGSGFLSYKTPADPLRYHAVELTGYIGSVTIQSVKKLLTCGRRNIGIYEYVLISFKSKFNFSKGNKFAFGSKCVCMCH